LAPGAGADAAGNTPDSTDLLMDQFETAGKFDSTSKQFAIALLADTSLDGQDESTTTSFMDLGTLTSSAFKSDAVRATIDMDSGEYYWKASMNGIRWNGINNSGYGFSDQKITIDTAREYIYVPETYYAMVFERLADFSTGFYINAEGDAIVDCSDLGNMQYF